MKLYYSPGACNLSPHIVLLEAGLDAELVRVDLKSKLTEHGEDFNAINPKGYVPALLLDDGEVLTEGPAIVQYLADLRPDSQLAPAWGTRERSRLHEWLNFIGTELHKSFSPLFRAQSEEWREVAIANLKRRFTYVAAHLKSHDYLLGERFSVADAYLFTVMSWGPKVGFDLSPWPALVAFQQRVGARPAVQAALQQEGLAA
ncbi:glutathione transferase GstA [Azoarcus sp. TTM-91]|uniref:glutathione transferase GstA n=1 Tax=Azoarcus sp. TTM-91 TaxID=2691581 RepID=UPI00145EE85B|nr:glutathione transferase GstA [Azoarcus sp. TTM-91]